MTTKRGRRKIPNWDSLLKSNINSAYTKPPHHNALDIFKPVEIMSNSSPTTTTGSKTTERTKDSNLINYSVNREYWDNTSDNTSGYYPYAPYYPPQTPYTDTDKIPIWKWPSQTIPSTAPKPEQVKTEIKPKHKPEELAGKIVAFATVKVQCIEYNGVLFVRRCGAWKLIDCRTMNKVASGSENSPMPDVTIHYIIYDEYTDKRPKKKSRFEDITPVKKDDANGT